jgi:uncharacterized membrane protein YdfJ with MMPL/SSD domain
VFSTVPSLMMSLNVAMSIDYSLFLLVRYRKEAQVGGNHREAVELMMRYAGHTVLVSGVTLVACFLGMLFYPIVIMRTLGLCCSIAVGATLFVNLSLTPLMLLAFPAFFMKGANADVFKYLYSLCVRAAKPSSEMTGLLARADTPEAREVELRRSWWYRFGAVIVQPRYAWLALVVIVGATIPVDLYAFNDKLVDDMTLNLPRGADSTDAYIQMGNTFGFGASA